MERARAEASLRDILRYVESSGCRQLLAHFGEDHPGGCGRCDVCAGEIALEDLTEAARMALSAAVRTGERFGAHQKRLGGGVHSTVGTITDISSILRLLFSRAGKPSIGGANLSLSACNTTVYFPEYQGGLNLGNGQVETPFLNITADFGFQCGMGMLHGYVKVVDDTDNVDLQAIRKQVSSIRPAAASAVGGCCGR